jgi:hypothetical protein
MKKLLLFIALFISAGQLMAQKATIAPFDNTLGGKLTQPFKTDSAWHTIPPTISTDKLFKQPDIDINKIELDKKFQTMIAINSDGYNMPVIKTDGYSKMPVIKLEGNSKMPIVGKDAGKVKTNVKVIP